MRNLFGKGGDMFDKLLAAIIGNVIGAIIGVIIGVAVLILIS